MLVHHGNPMGRIHETRLDTRKNLFVVAQLKWETGSASVRIRNISAVGALIEGDPLPSVGTCARLIRGGCSVQGQLVWGKANRAGFEALETITPEDWLPLHSRVRKGDLPKKAAAQAKAGDVAGLSHLSRDAIMADNLVRIRAVVEDVRVRLGLNPNLQDDRTTLNKLDDIHRLLSWQVGELQP